MAFGRIVTPAGLELLDEAYHSGASEGLSQGGQAVAANLLKCTVHSRPPSATRAGWQLAREFAREVDRRIDRDDRHNSRGHSRVPVQHMPRARHRLASRPACTGDQPFEKSPPSIVFYHAFAATALRLVCAAPDHGSQRSRFQQSRMKHVATHAGHTFRVYEQPPRPPGGCGVGSDRRTDGSDRKHRGR